MKVKKFKSRRLTVLEASLDDMNPEWFEPLTERLFETGALDVTLTPVIMKKGRPAILLSVLTSLKLRDKFLNILFEESTTLGVRSHTVERFELKREMRAVKTPYGIIPVKVGKDPSGRILNAAPEYDSCRRIAGAKGVPIKKVYWAAITSFNRC